MRFNWRYALSEKCRLIGEFKKVQKSLEQDALNKENSNFRGGEILQIISADYTTLSFARNK